MQTKRAQNLRAWKQFVRGEAERVWPGAPPSDQELQLTLVYLFDTDPVDIDNIIKPIQDALVGLVYADDIQVSDVDSHRRSLSGRFEIADLPVALVAGIGTRAECVYVRIREPLKLEEYL